MFGDKRFCGSWDEQPISNSGDFLGLAPCGLEFRQLALQNSLFGDLVQRHFQRQAPRRREVRESASIDRRLVASPAPLSILEGADAPGIDRPEAL